jgi:dehydrogenase/reductase SDR family member 4
MSNELNLEGKVAIVTGAARGIGKVTALALAQAKCKLVLDDRKLPDLDGVTKEINDLGAECLAVAAHLGKIEEVKHLVNEAINRFGRIDILVNNAATNPAIVASENLEERTWDHIMNVNLKGTFFLTQSVGREMIKHGGGKIINIATAGVIRPGQDGLLAYEVSKAGLIMMTKALAKEWGKYNICVTAIAPGLVATQLSEALAKDPVYKQTVLNSVALGRLGTPEEIAGMIIALASSLGNYVTGTTIVVDGGRVYH